MKEQRSLFKHFKVPGLGFVDQAFPEGHQHFYFSDPSTAFRFALSIADQLVHQGSHDLHKQGLRVILSFEPQFEPASARAFLEFSLGYLPPLEAIHRALFAVGLKIASFPVPPSQEQASAIPQLSDDTKKWSQAERRRFVAAIALLDESAKHIVIDGYDPAMIRLFSQEPHRQIWWLDGSSQSCNYPAGNLSGTWWNWHITDRGHTSESIEHPISGMAHFESIELHHNGAKRIGHIQCKESDFRSAITSYEQALSADGYSLCRLKRVNKKEHRSRLELHASLGALERSNGDSEEPGAIEMPGQQTRSVP